MADLPALGAMLNPDPTGGQAGDPATYEAGWQQVLKHPANQAALLNFGLQLLHPRWQASSALPDALSAGAHTVATNEATEHERADKAAGRAQTASEGEKNRKNQMGIAKLNADSRADVASMRADNAYALAGLKQTAGRTPEEEKFYQTVYANEMKNAMFAPPGTDPSVLAATRAQNAVDARRRQFGTGTPTGGSGAPGAGPATSGNPGNGPAPVGQPQPGAVPVAPSGNSGNTGNVRQGTPSPVTGLAGPALPHLERLEAKHPGITDRLMNMTDPRAATLRGRIEQEVSDPQNLPWANKAARMPVKPKRGSNE